MNISLHLSLRSLNVPQCQLYINNWICLFSGKWLGSRQIRCNWATKGAGTNDDKPNSDSKSVVELTNGSSGIVTVLCVYSILFISATQ